MNRSTLLVPFGLVLVVASGCGGATTTSEGELGGAEVAAPSADNGAPSKASPGEPANPGSPSENVGHAQEGWIAAPGYGYGLAAPYAGYGLAAPYSAYGVAAPYAGYGVASPYYGAGYGGAYGAGYGGAYGAGYGRAYGIGYGGAYGVGQATGWASSTTCVNGLCW